MQERYTTLVRRIGDNERFCALLLGVIFLFIGIAGFLPGFVSLPAGAPAVAVDAPRLALDDGYGYVLGLLPTNFLHNAVHITVGLLGLAAATSASGALIFNQGFAIAYTLIAVMGLLPFSNTTFGLMPIFGNNVWFNALTALIAGYYGFYKPIAKVAEIESSPGA